MSHNRDLSAAAAQLGFHSSNIGIGSEAPRYALDVYNSNLLVSGPSAGNIILEDRSVGDSSRPFHVVSSDGGKFVINRSNRNASGTTTSSANSLTLSSSGNLGLSGQTSPTSNIHIGDISGGYELKMSANALTFNRSSSSYIDQVNDSGRIIFRMTSSHTEAMRITSDGKIGINETSPDRTLHVKSGATDTALKLESTDAEVSLELADNTGSSYIGGGGSYLNFYSGGNERVRIDSAGRIGINETSPSHVLDVKSQAAGTYFINGQNHNGNNIFQVYESSDGDGNHGMLYLNNGSGATVTKISTNGSSYFIGGDIGVNITNPSSKLHVNLTKSSGTTSAERTKQHAAMRLSLDRTSGSMPYQGWGPALDFYSDNYDGSTQRPNARIAGVISNYSVGHEGGELRFYTTPTDTATSESDFAQRMTITSAGYVLKSQQPGFFARRSIVGDGRAAGAQEWTVSGTGSFNTGSHFNASNGRFTAPIAGRYLFTAAPGYKQSGQNFQFYFRINGGDASEPVRFIDGGNDLESHSLAAGSVIYNLSLNDYVDIYIGVTHHVNVTLNYFMGYLLG